MKDHRIVAPNGSRLPFSCSNSAYRTNVSAGDRHGRSKTLGSVFAKPLVSAHGYTLWLEHVLESKTGEQLYWLMWYDRLGKPTVPMSSVFGKSDLRKMLFLLATKTL
ncbi:MAG: hypothetical protein ABR998_08715 [Gemmatimonadales bacterium]|jgi:hypothetical protein